MTKYILNGREEQAIIACSFSEAIEKEAKFHRRHGEAHSFKTGKSGLAGSILVNTDTRTSPMVLNVLKDAKPTLAFTMGQTKVTIKGIETASWGGGSSPDDPAHEIQVTYVAKSISFS